jgi:hypothetical protein
MSDDWKNFLGDLDLDAIYRLGNEWIRMGDALYTEALNYTDTIANLAWTGAANNVARDAWHNNVQVLLQDAANRAWKIGESINYYGENIRKHAEQMVKDLNTQLFAAIFGLFLGLASLPVMAWAASFGAVVNAMSKFVDAMEVVASKFTAVTATAAEFSLGAIIGDAISLPIDMASLGLGSLAAHNKFHVDWAMEGGGLALGALFGGAMFAGDLHPGAGTSTATAFR